MSAEDRDPSLAELASRLRDGEASGPLELATAAAAALGELHDSGKILRAIDPGSIRFSTQDGLRARFDGGEEARAGNAMGEFAAPETLVRRGCRPEADQDYYALGKSFLAAVGGRDAALDRIMRKLSEKRASLRYRSVYGLLRDLDAARELPEGARAAFPLGSQDRDPQAFLRPVFAGRVREIERARALAREAVARSGGIVLVSGRPGVGKTAFVRAALGPSSPLGLRYAEGKSERGSGLPFTALGQAFRDYLESRSRSTTVPAEREDVARIAALFDDPRAGAPGSPRADEPRKGAREPLVNAILAIARAEKGLVLFIDDLQWADLASVETCALAVSLGEAPLCIAIAYRDGEIEWEREPYSRLVRAAVGDLGGELASNEINLGPLGARDLEACLEASLPGLPVAALASLSRDVYGFSGGLPQHAVSVLRERSESGELAFSSLRGTWSYRNGDSRARGGSSDAVGLIAEGLSRLDAGDGALLFASACFPSPMPLDLAIRYRASRESADPEETRARIDRLVDAGYLYWRDEGLRYAFSHDNVKEAALRLGDADLLRAASLGLARLLASAKSRTASPFETAELYIASGRSAASPVERRRCAEVCLAAAREASAAFGFDSASRYAEGGLAFLDPDSWDADYGLCLELHAAAMSAAMKARLPARARELADVIDARAKDEMDRLPALETRAMLLMGEHRLGEAVEAFVGILRGLGYRIHGPEAPTLAALQRALNDARLRLYLERRRHGPLDRRARAALRVCMESFTAAYVSDIDTCAEICSVAFSLAVEREMVPSSPLHILCYAQVECMRGRHGLGKRARDIALRSAKELGVEGETPFPMVLQFFIEHYYHPVREGMGPIEECYEESMRTGNYEYAGVCANFMCFDLLFYGGRLSAVRPTIERYIEKIKAIHQERSLTGMRRTLQLCLSLQGESCADAPWRFSGPYFDEAVELPRIARNKDESGLATSYFCSLFVAYILGETIEARKRATELEGRIGALRSQSIEGGLLFYLALVLVSRLPGEDETETRAGRKRARRILAGLVRRDRDPSSCYHYLAAALRARIRQAEGRRRGVEEGYKRALEGAARAECLADRGCIAELLASWYRENGQPALERALLAEAHSAFAAWGAAIKTSAMEREHPWLAAAPGGGPAGGGLGPERERDSASLDAILPRLERVAVDTDFESVAAANLEAIMEWTGAERALLAREPEGESAAWASCERAGDGIVSVAIGDGEKTPVPDRLALRASLAGTAKLGAEELRGILLRAAEGAAAEPEEPASRLVLPLEFHGKRGGILVLEHDSVAGLFAPGELGRIRLLALQASAALDQAMLAKRLEAQRREREELLRAEKLTALGILGASVGHEVRAPVHAIRMNAAFLRSRLVETGADREDECLAALRDIDESAVQIGEIAADLTGFAKDRGGPETVSLGEVARSALRLAGDFLSRSGARLELELSKDELRFTGSASRAKQLVIILVENACQALPDAGGLVRVSTFGTDDSLVLGVDDTGSGIAPEALSRVTEAFFTTKEGGTGLGLAIAKGIVRELGGALEIRSEPGEGTSVRVRIPRRRPA